MTDATFDVLAEQFSVDDPVAVGGEGTRTLSDLRVDLACLNARLTCAAGEPVVVACGDRYRVLLALLALWRRGAVAVLPSSVQAGAIDQVLAETHAVLVLHDGEGSGVDLRTWLQEPSPRSSTLPSFPFTFAAAQTLVLLSTSGSTGAPMTVAKTARQLFTEVGVLARTLGQPRPHAVLSTVPARHIYGLLFGVLWPLRMGVPFVRSSPLLPDAIAHTARSHEADVLVAVPAHLNGFAAARDLVHPLKRVFTSGAALSAATWRALIADDRMQVTEVLGSTETGGIATRNLPDAHFVPFAGITVAAGIDGRMLLNSPYLSDDLAQPHRADDAIECQADGSFRWLGRGDGIVKVGGVRVSPAQIEAQARAIAGVEDAAVLTIEVPSSRGHELWLAVAARDHDAASLRRALSQVLASVALPRRYRVVDRLPREDNGKLTHARLRALFDDAPHILPDLHGFSVIAQQLQAMPARAEFTLHVPTDLVYFRGHFDGHPILPGVVQLQCIVTAYAQHLWRALGMPRGARRLKFTRPIAPGEDLHVALSRVVDDRVDFKLTVAREVCAQGSVLFDGQVQA